MNQCTTRNCIGTKVPDTGLEVQMADQSKVHESACLPRLFSLQLLQTPFFRTRTFESRAANHTDDDNA